MSRRANIIVASTDGDQLAELLDGANEISDALKSECEVSPRVATSIDDIRAKRTQDTLLLIIAASLPQSRSSCDQDMQPAIDFVRSIATGPNALPCILVSERLEHYRVAQSIRCCELLVVDNTTDYVDYCLQLARKLDVIRDRPKTDAASSGSSIAGSSTITQKTIAKYAVVEVDLPTDLNMSKVRLEIHDGNEPREPFSEPLRLKKSDVAQLVKDSKGLKKKFASWRVTPERYYSQWQDEYQRLGERLGRLLWSTQSFTAFYNHGIGAADNNIRIRFNLEQPWFDGLWEALRVRSGQRVLMLDNTVARRALPKDPAEYVRRDHDKIAARGGELRILVIQSDPGNVPPENRTDPLWLSCWERHGGTLAPLKHLKKEVEALCSVASLAQAGTSAPAIKIVVDVLPTEQRATGEPWSLAAMTQGVLENSGQGYDIVHFAGHALFLEDGKKREKGYLVFSGHPRPQAVSISVVAEWLAKAGVQLAYLSCCRSNAALAALELARNSIPMAIGFHWDVEDEKAPAFAKEFYGELLNFDLKVCPAISKARRNLFNGSQGSDPIWASPVLIAQPGSWIQVEAVLKPPAPKSAESRQAA